jgi:hypothetical protein
LKNILLAFLFVAFSGAAKASLVAEFYVDGTMNGPMEPGKASKWEMSFYYMSTGERAKMFMRMHEKYMHMVVVSKDLEHFAHVHPTFDMRILRLSATPPYKKKGQHFAGIWYFKIAKN